MWGRLLTVCLVVAMLAAAAAPASANTEAGLAFAQGDALALDWDALEEGSEEVPVCNGGSQLAKPLRVRLAGFGFKFTDQATEVERQYEPSEVLEVSGPPEGIAAGSCGDLTLTLVDPGLEIDAGVYSGSITVVASGLGVARLALNLTGPGTVTKAAAVHGAVDEATLEAHNPSPWGDPRLVGGAELLLKLPRTGEQPLSIGEDCVQAENGDWGDKCPFIGNLYKGTDAIGVYVAGKVVEVGGVARLPIRISGSHAVGDYQGTLDPSLTGDKEQAVKTKLSATDSVCWPIGALLLGTAIALAIQLWSGRWRPKYLLNQRKDDLLDSYLKACEEVNGRGAMLAGEKLTVELDELKVKRYVTEVKDAIWRYSWSTLLFDTDSDAYKQIESSLAQAEEDRMRFVAKDGLQKSLVDLAEGIEKTEGLLLRNHLVVDLTELLTRARALLGERKLSVGDATARAKKASQLTASLKSWCKLAERVLGAEGWLFALAKHAAGGKVGQDDQEVLNDLAVRLRAVHQELFQAEGDEDLERLRISGRIETAHGQLAYLAAKHGVEKPTTEPVKLLEANLLAPVEKAFASAFKLEDVKPADLPGDLGEVLSEPASAVQLPNRKLRVVLFDSLVLLFAAGAAVFAGLTAFYFGKAFGNWQDYATVIVTGTAAQLVVKAILDNFSAFWHDISPLTNLERAQTKVLPKSE